MGVTTDMRGLMREWLAAADREYCELGWPTVPAHRPLTEPGSCSCGRVSCDAPGAHPISASWREEVTEGADVGRRRRLRDPDANILLATGHRVDALEVPAAAGAYALNQLERDAGALLEPVAVHADRYLFFVDSWHGPGNAGEPVHRAGAYAVRWHTSGSYVLLPPSVTPGDRRVFWLRRPSGRRPPDPMRLVEALVAACTRLRPPARTDG